MAQHHALYEELCGLIGKEYVRDNLMSRISYSYEMSPHDPVISGVVCRPGTTEEVAEIVKLANRMNCPVTLRGGGQSANGLTKGIPNKNIVIDTGRLNQVSVIDTENQRAVFGAGIRPKTLDDALRPYGYFAHTVLAPYYTDSMGGLISGVSGGGYPKDMGSVGLLWHHILGLKVVLPTGEIITTGAGPDTNVNRDGIYYRCQSAPDLTGLFISSGGVFGIITEITMRIYKIPPILKGVCYTFNTYDELYEAEMEMSETAPVPYTGLFATDAPTIRIAAQADPPGDFNYCLLISVEAYDEDDANTRLGIIEKICRKHGGGDGGPAADYFACVGFTGQCLGMRVTDMQQLPFLSWECLYQRSDALEILYELDKISKENPEMNEKYKYGHVFYTIPIDNFVLVGITMHWDVSQEEAGPFMIEKWRKGAKYLNDVGSCTAYTQGINSGVIAEKWSPMQYMFMKNMKKMLDPNNILCPGLWNL